MNRMHRSLWNSALGAWVAVPERTRARGKRSGSASASGLRLRRLAMACLLAWAAPFALACDAGDTASLANCVTNIAADPARTINLTADITLSGNIGVLEGSAGTPITINGNGHILDGAGTYRGFFLGSGTVSINDLTLQNLRAKGGDGGEDVAMGGGGMGAGGAVFARSGVALTMNNVSLIDNSAVGGNSNINFALADPLSISMSGGGGGGLGGAGGGARAGLAANVGQGGGGLYAVGGVGTDGTHAGSGGGPYGGAGETVYVIPSGGSVGTPPGAGGDYSGGGGATAVRAVGGGNGSGAPGGFGGGGGGAYVGPGGAGGFGGGGGGSFDLGGAGGFGGGGGQGVDGGGLGGFGGGLGSQYNGGGGGAGMGGAVFIQDGASLTLTGSFSVNGNAVTAGRGAYDALSPTAPANRASAFGAGFFLQGSASALTFSPGSGATQTISDTIADQTGSGGTGINAGSIGIVKAGAGTLELTGANTYSGGTDLQQGRLDVGHGGALGTGVLTMHGGTTLGFMADTLTLANAVTLAGAADATIDTGNFVGFLAGDISGAGNLYKAGANTLTLSGSNSYRGATTVSAGTLRAGIVTNAFGGGSAVTVYSGATLDLNNLDETIGSLAGAGNVSLGNGTLTAGTDNTSTVFSGLIAGSGGLNKVGAGTMTLSGANSYRGRTTVGAGTLRAGIATNAFGSASAVTVNSGATLDLNNLDETIGSLAGAGNVSLGNGTLTAGTDHTSTGYSGRISGSGGLTKTGIGTLTLSGANTYTGATTVDGGTLQAGAENTFSATSAVTMNSGRLDLNNYNQTIGSLTGFGRVDLGIGTLTTGRDNSSTTYSGVISGSGGLTKNGTGTLTLDRDNAYTGVTTINEGVLRLDNGNGPTGLGASTARVVVNSGGTLDVNGQYGVPQHIDLDGGTLASSAQQGRVTGTIHLATGRTNTIRDDGLGLNLAGVIDGDSIIIDGTGRVIYEAANTYTGTTTIRPGATLDTTAASVGNGSGIVNHGTLNFNQQASGAVSQPISGSGQLVKWEDGRLTLSGANSYSGGTAIYGGTLAISSDQNLGAPSGALTLDDGTLRTSTAAVTTRRDILIGFWGGGFDTRSDLTVTGVISGDSFWGDGGLHKFGPGTLTLTGANTFAGGTFVETGTLSVSADGNMGAASGELTLAGTLRTTGAFTTERQINLEDNGGTFQTDAELVANGLVRGPGALTKTGAASLTLTGTNRYRGGTRINAGTLAVSADANLGHASGGLSFDGGTLRNTGAFSTARSIQLEAGGGTLQTDADLGATGVISGAGGITKTGTGTLTLSGENSYSGGTDLKQGRLAVTNNSALGTGELAMHEGTTLRFAADGLTLANPIQFTEAVDPVIDTGAFTSTLTGAITGPGDLSKIGTGTLVLSGANTYSGATAVTEGTLRAGADGAFSPASAHSVAAGAALDLAGFRQRIAALNNAGTVSLIGSAPGNTFTVTGPYIGNDGLLRLGTFLGDSASASDRLVLAGPTAAASGHTTVQVVNLGGLGALTTGDGIELVSALDGATTTAQSTRDAFVLQGGHVDAGAYEYRLKPGDAQGAGENWYLRSTSTLHPPEAQGPPVAPVPALPSAPAGPVIQVPTYRAEVPLFSALPGQLAQANAAMLGNLHRRIGDDDAKTLSPPQGSTATPATHDSRAWGRVLSTGLDIRQSGTVRPHSDGRLSGLQAGTDLWRDTAWRAGLFTGQLDGELQVQGFARGAANLAVGSNDLRSQYLGGYATYGADSGFYLDAVLQLGRHRYEVKPQSALRTAGRASSLSASLEIGQAFELGDGWQIEPQAQLVHQDIEFDDVNLRGTRVQQESDRHWLARVGVRVKGDVNTRAGRLQPYARMNLYRAGGGDDAARFVTPAATTTIVSSNGGTSAELAAGFTLGLSESTSLFGEVGKLWATGGDTRVKSQLNASAGLRLRW